MSHVAILYDRDQVGAAAADRIATILRQALADQDRVRVIFAAAPSQTETLATLVATDGIDWGRIEAFHMDEYLGLPPDHPAGFANWLDAHLFSLVPLRAVHRIVPGNNPEQVASDYAKLLQTAPIDLVVGGIGETGHLAFNDPAVADFNDRLAVKIVELDVQSRRQQVEEACFPSLDQVPTHAITVTIPPLMAARSIVCVVPGAHKRAAVTAALTGPVTVACPASILQTHPDVDIFVDRAAGADLLLAKPVGMTSAVYPKPKECRPATSQATLDTER